MKRILILNVIILLCLVCSGCGHEHKMKEKTLLEVTCEDNGKIEHYCAECDYSYIDYVERKGHDYSEEKILLKATCTKAGKKELICNKCGDKIEQVIVANHTLEEEIVTEPSCKKSGAKKLTCTVCDYEKN